MSNISRQVNLRQYLFRGLLVLLFLCLLWILFSKFKETDSSITPEVEPFKTTKVRVDVYYEVLCPDSRYFVLHQLVPAFDKVGEAMDIHYVPYGKASHKKGPRGWEFQCQHGPIECKGNMVHACATKYVKRPEQLIQYIRCMIQDNYDALGIGKSCANEYGIDWAPIHQCVSGREGEDLLSVMGDDTHALRPKVSFIPTIKINGSQDGQKDILKNLLKEVCKKLQGEKGEQPTNCIQIL